MSQQQKGETSQLFGEALRRLRGTTSQAKFARRLGISHQQTYARYEAGQVPGGETLKNMARRLGVSVDYLLGCKPHDSDSGPRSAPSHPREAGKGDRDVHHMAEESGGFGGKPAAASEPDCLRYVQEFLRRARPNPDAASYVHARLRILLPLEEADKLAIPKDPLT